MKTSRKGEYGRILCFRKEIDVFKYFERENEVSLFYVKWLYHFQLDLATNTYSWHYLSNYTAFQV